MMRSLFRGIVVTLAALGLVFGVMAPAFANTNLVPASRLIAPFFDISSNHDTFYVLANVSGNVNLTGAAFGPSSSLGPWGVHLEHYGQSCDRIDETDLLSPFDVDQFDLLVNSTVRNSIGAGQAIGPVTATATQSGVAGRGWSDIDVRFGSGVLTSSTSIQANVLVGTVVISDFGNDFAVAYPMASIVGTNFAGKIGGAIVFRDANGTATAWTGRYEPLPARLFVPVFFAEGTETTASTTTTFSAFLAIAAPPDGNWSGIGNGEAPGQDTGRGAIKNMQLNFLVFDGCEKNVSFNFPSHYVNNTYAALFGANTNRSTWTIANCGITFAGRDELSNQAVGWIDITNTNVSCGNSNAACVTNTATPGVNNGVGQKRGMVGITIENVVQTVPTSLKEGDVTRLWGDPSPWGQAGGAFNFTAVCSSGLGICNFSLVDRVNHSDIGQGGSLTTTNTLNGTGS